jgi:diacylglycerol O-acyltransferase / wax synthase
MILPLAVAGGVGGPAVERLSTLDAGFYFVEHQNVPMHIGSLAVFDGPAPKYGDLFALFESKIPRVPRYRQVVRTLPLQVFRPFWADDQQFELDYHLRHSVVPAPGKTEQLRELASRVFSQRLDRDRPLWEAWFLDGLERGRWAILMKVHHSMVDGIGGSDLLAELFDLSPDAAGPGRAERSVGSRSACWEPRPSPSTAELVLGGALDAFTWPVRQLAELPGLVTDRLPSTSDVLEFGRGLTGSARRLTAPSAASLNGPISPHRRWTWTTAKLSQVKRVRQALGVTVNDVVLAVITSGYRELLRERGELADDLVVRSLVPVSLRGADDRHPVTNQISAILANLPVGEADPLRRLELLHSQMEDLKRTRQAVGAEFLTGLLGFAAPSLLALGSRAAFRLPQPLVQTVTTNVPGPRFPLYLLGRKLRELYPYVPIGDRLLTGVAVFSYLDHFAFGVTADYRAVSKSDLRVLTNGIKSGLAELKEKARQASLVAGR